MNDNAAMGNTLGNAEKAFVKAKNAEALKVATDWALNESDGKITEATAKMIIVQVDGDLTVDWHDLQIKANKAAAKIRKGLKAKAPKSAADLEFVTIQKVKKTLAGKKTTKKTDPAVILKTAIERAAKNWSIHPAEALVVANTLRPEDVKGKTDEEMDHLIRIVRRAMRKTCQLSKK